MNPVAPSRPLRSLTLFLVAWVLLRALTIWSGNIVVDVEAAPAIAAVAHRPSIGPAARPAIRFTRALEKSEQLRVATRIGRPSGDVLPVASHGAPALRTKTPATVQPFMVGPTVDSPAPVSESAVPTIPAGAPTADGHNRWSGSAWLLVRRDGPKALGTAGELGGSQAGARIFYGLDHTIAATARISRALSHAQGGEASVGIAIRHRNIGLLLERRVALDRGGRNDFSATAYAGVSNIAVTRDVRLDGYAQAGIVGTDKFVDGAVRIERTLTMVKQLRISAGAGFWGGAQPGVERIDVGPQIVAHISVAGRNLRASAEWRQRIAGDAAPSSGPSMTLGLDL